MEGRIQDFANEGHRLDDVYCDVTVMVMKSDVIIDFSADVARTNVHLVAGILLDPPESKVLGTIYLLRALCAHACM